MLGIDYIIAYIKYRRCGRHITTFLIIRENLALSATIVPIRLYRSSLAPRASAGRMAIANVGHF
jgi:hypothetical protein